MDIIEMIINSPAAVALITGLVTGFFTLNGVKKSNKYNIELKNLQDLENTKHILIAFKEEINQVYERFYSSIGKFIEDYDGTGFIDLITKCDQKYFSIYENVSPKIGTIKDENLIKSIIKTYTVGSGMIETMTMYSEIFEKYIDFVVYNNEKVNDITYQKISASYYARLTKLTQEGLIKDYKFLTESKKETIGLIDKYLKNNYV